MLFNTIKKKKKMYFQIVCFRTMPFHKPAELQLKKETKFS